MAAPGGWPPQDQWGYPAGPPPAQERRAVGWIIAGAILGSLVLIAGAVGVFLVVTDDEEAGASEVFLEPAASTGPDPFTASVATSAVSTSTSSTTTTPPTTTASGGIPSYDGGEPGLYGGTRDIGSCNPTQLVEFLEENPSKARAWAGVLGIAPTEIRSYVGTLTTVVLRGDTRVTNHGYANGRATTIASVLQAGTAVLVDDRGVPVVKCACGNPLTAPTPIRTPTYTGARWQGFSPTSIVVIQRSTTVIETFVLTGPDGERFTRPAGGTGSDDGPDPDTTTPTSGTTQTTPSSTTTTSASSTTTTTRPPTTSTTRPATAQQVGLSASTGIDGQGVVGSQEWTATVTIGADGAVTGSGSGSLVGSGVCLDNFGQPFSEYTARVSFAVTVRGTTSGQVMNATASAPSGSLDSVTYSVEGSMNDACRAEAQSTYLTFVNQSMGSFSVSTAAGSSGTIQANFPGTVTVTG